MPFVASEGSVRQLAGRLYPSIQQRIILGGFAQDYLQIWKTQGAVRTTISFLGRNVAQLPLKVYRRKGDADREQLFDHPLADLLRKPNPWTTQYRFLDFIVHDLSIYDRSYWVKSKGPNGISLLRQDPLYTYPKGELGFYPEYFEVRGRRGTKQYPADEVFFLRGYAGGMADTGGVSPIESLREVLEESFYAGQTRAQTMRNGARMSGYIKRPAGATWSDTAKTTFKADWQAQYSGTGPQAGGTPILEDDMDFVPVSMTPKDLQYIEGRKLTREEVAQAYYIPPPMIGLLENATFSNIVEQHQMLYSDTLGPTLVMIQGEVGLQLVPDVAPGDDVYAEFSLAEKLRGAFEVRQAAIQSAVGGPTMTTNEGRALDNLPPVEGGDELIRPLNVTAPGDQNPKPAAPAPMMTPTNRPPAEAAAGRPPMYVRRRNGALVRT
jgi:HK97 family phage portal protein